MTLNNEYVVKIKIITKLKRTLIPMILNCEFPKINEKINSNNPGKMSVKIGITSVNVEIKIVTVNNDPIIEAVYFPSIFNFIRFLLLCVSISGKVLHRLAYNVFKPCEEADF